MPTGEKLGQTEIFKATITESDQYDKDEFSLTQYGNGGGKKEERERERERERGKKGKRSIRME